jgi:hypothetical protein
VNLSPPPWKGTSLGKTICRYRRYANPEKDSNKERTSSRMSLDVNFFTSSPPIPYEGIISYYLWKKPRNRF